METEQVHRLVEKIYDAALDQARWQEALADLRVAFKSLAVGFFTHTADLRLIAHAFDGIDASEMARYDAQFSAANPWFSVPRLMVPGLIRTDLTLEQLHRSSRGFLDTPMCREWCLPQDFRHAMGGTLAQIDDSVLNFTLFRPRQAGYYSDADVESYRKIARHLLRATEIARRLDDARLQARCHEELLEALRLGVIMVGWTGRILFVNNYARTLFAQDRTKIARGGMLRQADPHNATRLNATIERASERRETTSCQLTRPRRAALSVTVLPVSGRRSFLALPRVQLTILVVDPDDRTIGSADYLAQRWSLTKKEARFTLHLLRGASVVDIAARMRLTSETAKWYCKQVRHKVGAAKQSELILKLMSDLPGALRSDALP